MHNFNILASISIEDLEKSPSSTLYRILLTTKKQEFNSNERILFTCYNKVKQETLDYISWCLNHIDIPMFFVVLSTNQDNVRDFFTDIDNSVTVNTDIVPVPAVEKTADPLFYNSHLCPHAWAGFHVWPDGNTSPCCDYDGSFKNLNIKDNTFEEILYSDDMAEIRDQFRNNKVPAGCAGCIKKEQYGLSRRSIAQHKMKNIVGVIDYESEGNLMYMGGHLGNLCNLKCRICNSSFSSSIAAEDIKHGTESQKIKALANNKENRWSKNSQNFWDELKDHSDVCNIEFLGGEPLLLKEYINYIEWLVDNNLSNNVMLELTTNGTVLPDVIANHANKFLHVGVTFSIDNIGKRFEFERSGANWDSVEKNIKYMIDQPSCQVGINTTVNIQNVYYIPELLDWAESLNLSYHSLNVLDDPYFMSIHSVVPSFIEPTITKLKKYKDQSKVQHIIDCLEQSTTTSGDELFAYMDHKDNIRRQDFTKSHPEVSAILKK